MKRLVLFAAIHAACAIDDPTVSTDEAEVIDPSFDPRGFEVEGASVSGSIQRIVNHERASNGAYLTFNGAGSARVFFSHSSYDPPRTLVWARVIAPSSASNSIYFELDSQTPIRWELPVSTTWTWVPIEGWKDLAGGQHTFKLTTDEPGVQVDRVLFAFRGDFFPITDTYEAESGGLVYPMRIATQKLPYTTYAYTPNGYGSNGRLDLDVTQPAANSYTVWLRANAASASDNTIRIGRDGSPSTLLDLPITSTSGWTWSKKSSLTLDVFDVLSIGTYDDGVKIDKVLITNDAGFRLIESSPPQQSTL